MRAVSVIIIYSINNVSSTLYTNTINLQQPTVCTGECSVVVQTDVQWYENSKDGSGQGTGIETVLMSGFGLQ